MEDEFMGIQVGNPVFWQGVFASMLATPLLFLFRWSLLSAVSMIAGLFTRNIRGTWSTTFWKSGTEHHETVEVYQLLHRVWGKIHYSAKARSYVFRGTLRANVL